MMVRKLLGLGVGVVLLIALMACGGSSGGGGDDGGGTSQANLQNTGWVESSGTDGRWTMSGSFVNNGNGTAKNVKVYADLYDKDGNYLDTSWTYLDTRNLEAGASSTFSDTSPTTAFSSVASKIRKVTWQEEVNGSTQEFSKTF
jgi:hypothetical protein